MPPQPSFDELHIYNNILLEDIYIPHKAINRLHYFISFVSGSCAVKEVVS